VAVLSLKLGSEVQGQYWGGMLKKVNTLYKIIWDMGLSRKGVI
jgi:hypothetical protein